LKSRRQTLHRSAAEALIEANEDAEAIAHHLTEAGLDNLAIEWWSKAGEDALRRSPDRCALCRARTRRRDHYAGGRLRFPNYVNPF